MALILAGLFALAMLGLSSDYVGERLCGAAIARLPTVLGAQVRIAECRVDPFRAELELRGVALVPPDEGHAPVTGEVERASVQLRLLSLLRGAVRLDRIELDAPRIVVDLSREEGEGAPPSPPAREGKKACFLDALRRFEIANLALTDAAVSVKLSEGRWAEIEHVDVGLQGESHRYRAQLSVGSGRVSTGSLELPLSRLRAQGTLETSERRFTLSNLELAAGDLSLSARGELSDLCDARMRLEMKVATPLDLIGAMLGPSTPELAGRVTADIYAHGPLNDPEIDADVSFAEARVNQFVLGDAFLSARVAHGAAVVEKLSIPIGDGRVVASGTVALTGGLPADAQVDLDNVSFGRIVDRLGLHGTWVDFRATGRVAVSGALAPFHLTGPVALDVRDFRVHDHAYDYPSPKRLLEFDVATLEATADFDPTRVKLGDARVRTQGGSDLRAEAAIGLHTRTGLRVDVSFDPLDLGELGHLLSIPWSGIARGTALVAGPYGDIGISGDVAIHEFKFQQLAVASVRSEIDFRHGKLSFNRAQFEQGRTRLIAEGGLDFTKGESPHCHGNGIFEWGRLSDLVAMVGDTNGIFDILRNHAESRFSGEAEVTGTIAQPASRIALALSDATFYGRQLGDGQFVFRSADGNKILIDTLRFQGPIGQIEASGRVDLDEGLSFDIDAPTLDVSELAKSEGESPLAKGTLVLKARIAGPPQDVRLDGTLTSRELSVFDVPLGDGTLALSLAGKDLAVTGQLGDALEIGARVRTEAPYPFAATVDAATYELGRFIRKPEGIRGELVGQLAVEGNLERWNETRGTLQLSRLVVGKEDYVLTNDAPVKARFDGARVFLRSLAMRGPTGTRLSVTGRKDAEGRLALSIDGGFDLRAIEPFFDWIDQAGGKVDISAALTGPIERPTLVGTAEVRDARFHVAALPFPNTTRELNGRIEFSQSRAYFSDFSGALNDGRAQARGEVEMENLIPTRIDLQFGFDEVSARLPGELPGVFSGDLKFHGPLDSITMSGDIDVLRLRYTQAIDPATALRQLNTRHGAAAVAFERPKATLKYDVGIHVTGDVRIDNNLVKAGLGGELRLVGDNVRWGLIGTVGALEGSRAYFRGNEFTLGRVVIDLNDRERLGGLIDAAGEAQVRDYRVFMHVHGSLDDPQVDLSSEPELARADVMTLLTLGVTSRESGGASAYSTGTGASLVGETLWNLTGLDKRMRDFIPKNPLIRDLSVNLSTQYSEVSGIVEPTAQFEVRFLSEAMRLRLSQPMLTGRGRRAQIEYRFNNRASAQAQWEAESGDYGAVGDLGLDLKLRWEME